MDQWAYIKDIISEWIGPDNKTWVPMTTTPAKVEADIKTHNDLKCDYPKLVGKLLWVSTTVHPNICYTVNMLARHISKPTEEVM